MEVPGGDMLSSGSILIEAASITKRNRADLQNASPGKSRWPWATRTRHSAASVVRRAATGTHSAVAVLLCRPLLADELDDLRNDSDGTTMTVWPSAKLPTFGQLLVFGLSVGCH